jgi:hypothetical protein
MQYPIASAKRPAELVGEIIDSNYAQQLIRGFKETFPGEVTVRSIESKTIFNSVKDIPNVSGIRFMYGMGSADDPASKVILLIPCNNTSTHQPIPNTIVQPEGYLNNKGERVGLRRTWELLYNHAVHYAKLQPEIKFKQIFRGAFFGIDSLTSLLTKVTEAHSVNYHFGFDENITDTPLQHKAVLNPLHIDGTQYNVYFDVNSPCPPDCYNDEPPSTCCMAASMVDNFPKTPDNGPLVEMYYYISPALTEAIVNTGRAKDIYQSLYHNQVSQCNKLIEEGRYDAAKMLFEQTMEYLMKEYLFC